MKTTTFFLIFPLATLMCHGQTQARAPLQLSLKRAIELGTSTEGNASVQIAAEAVQIAKAKSNELRADLLPELEGSIGVQSMTRNLSAMGIRSEGALADIGIPRTVGPFRVFDARVTSSQKVLDMGAIRRFQSSKVSVRAEQSSRNATVDQAAAAIAKSYVAALRAGAELEAIEANVALAQALLVQAERQERGGIGTGVEVTRAKVQLANEQQRKIAASNEFTRTKLELLRAMGRSLDLDIELTDKLNLSPPGTDTAQAFRQALTRRSDWKAQLDS
jgi:outer membrane protein